MASILQWINFLRSEGIIVESHLRLFTYEAGQYMTDEEFHNLRKKYIEPKHFEKRADELFISQTGTRQSEPEGIWLLNMWNDAEKYGPVCHRIAKERMFRLITYICRDHSDMVKDLFEIVRRCEDSADPQLYKELIMADLQTYKFYRRLFVSTEEKYAKNKMDRLAAVLESQIIYPAMRKKNAHDYEAVLVRSEMLYKRGLKHGHFKLDIQQRLDLEQNNLDMDAAACVLLRGLPFCTDTAATENEPGDWYYHFMEACDTDPQTRVILELVDPNIREDLSRWHAHKTVDRTNWAPNDSTFIIINQNEQPPMEPRDPRDYESYRNIEAGIDYEPNEYLMRPYQNELVMHAINGKNAIVCAPTGSGKTIVATDIIKNHLESAKRDGRVARAVMLVPTVPLVDQQSLKFVEYLGGTFWIDGFSGCENCYDDRAQRLLACDLCVMTPQILLNMLDSVLRSEHLYLSDFTLMIFDECHHCDKSHPYKILMDKLADLENAVGFARKPQVVGLTASMGVGDSGWDMAACQQHMLKLCANLRAETISTVRHQMVNLKQYVTPPVDSVVKVSRPANNEFLNAIKKCMYEIQLDMKEDLDRIVNEKLLGDAFGKVFFY